MYWHFFVGVPIFRLRFTRPETALSVPFRDRFDYSLPRSRDRRRCGPSTVSARLSSQPPAHIRASNVRPATCEKSLNDKPTHCKTWHEEYDRFRGPEKRLIDTGARQPAALAFIVANSYHWIRSLRRRCRRNIHPAWIVSLQINGIAGNIFINISLLLNASWWVRPSSAYSWHFKNCRYGGIAGI